MSQNIEESILENAILFSLYVESAFKCKLKFLPKLAVSFPNLEILLIQQALNNQRQTRKSAGNGGRDGDRHIPRFKSRQMQNKN